MSETPSYTVRWHSYIGDGIDGSKVHKDARERMVDRYDPGTSVIHDHASTVACKGHPHTIYTYETQEVFANVYVDDGNAVWSIPDPRQKDGKTAMSTKWYV
jgi:hypothetical protein